MFLGYLFANDLGMFSGAGLQLTMFQVVATFIGLLVMGFILYVLVVSIKSWNFKKNQLSNDDGWDNGLF
jgi:type III secretory pathway component EscU